MSGIQSPEMLNDLYRDLRDRRLLPLVIVLVVGMAVVPIALSSSPEAAPPTPTLPPASATLKSNAPAEQIVVADPGLRDYKRRLKGDETVDPFVQKFLSGGGDSTAETAAADAGGGVSSATSAPPTDTTSTVPGSPTGGGTTTVQTEVRTDNKVVFYRLKVRTGPVGGEMKIKDGVGPSAQLPNGSVPALVFLGANFNGDLDAQRAYFLVSNGVSSISGDGVCGLGDPCQLVSVKPGQYVDLVWVDGQTYRVKLLAFERHVRDQVPGDFISESGTGSGNRAGK